jgi:hypothetical protein
MCLRAGAIGLDRDLVCDTPREKVCAVFRLPEVGGSGAFRVSASKVWELKAIGLIIEGSMGRIDWRVANALSVGVGIGIGPEIRPRIVFESVLRRRGLLGPSPARLDVGDVFHGFLIVRALGWPRCCIGPRKERWEGEGDWVSRWDLES